MTLPEMLKDKCEPLQSALQSWFQQEARDLPWRQTRDPYAIWVSEIMLQQTRIDQGIPYYKRFMEAFPTVNALAEASEDQVLKVWEGLGYYGRARNLHKAAQVVINDRNGKLPKRAADWRKLPGVGRYTAGAITSIAFGEVVPVLDGNVKRVLTRLFDIADCIDDAVTENTLWAVAESLMPSSKPGDFNQAMMELGALLCTPKRPQCDICPVFACCEARTHGVQEQRPVRKPKKAIPHREQVVAAIFKDDRYLIAKRPSEGLLGGLWEMPSADILTGETHQQALTRHIKETFELGIQVGGLVATVTHAYTHFRITLHVYRCKTDNETPQPAIHTEFRWVRPAHFERYAFPKANLKFLGLLE